MAIIIKTPEEIEKLREGGKRLAEVLHATSKMVAPGVSTMELDLFAQEKIKELGDESAFLGYRPVGHAKPFPAALCVSINREVVHGIPKANVYLKEGDIVSIDLGLKHEGLFTDHAITCTVGKVSKEKQHLISATHEALYVGIEAIKPGARTGDIGFAIETYAKKSGGYGVVRALAGHGVGKAIHEDPYIPNYGKPGRGDLLVPGMVIAIEPMFTLGTWEVIDGDDGYTIKTADGTPAAHFEHTILVTETGYEILTEL